MTKDPARELRKLQDQVIKIVQTARLERSHKKILYKIKRKILGK